MNWSTYKIILIRSKKNLSSGVSRLRWCQPRSLTSLMRSPPETTSGASTWTCRPSIRIVRRRNRLLISNSSRVQRISGYKSKVWRVKTKNFNLSWTDPVPNLWPIILRRVNNQISTFTKNQMIACRSIKSSCTRTCRLIWWRARIWPPNS